MPNPALANPFCSVLIRSCNRLPNVLEIIEVCLAQDYEPFEVVVMEQSTEAHWREYEHEFRQLDHRVRVIRSEPLGSSMAKNVGALHCRGDIVLFMDDDDLPLGTNWISAHAAHYADPLCLGVSGRIVREYNEACRYRHPDRDFHRALTYSFFMRGRDHTGIDRMKQPVDWLHGINASIRRSYILELGGWYPHAPNFDEHSLIFNMQTVMESGEYLAFDPVPQARRRYHLPGGLNKRFTSFTRFVINQMKYLHWVVAPHFPLRFYGFYPLFILDSFLYSARWLRKHSRWSDSIFMPRLGKRMGREIIILLHLPLLPFMALRYLVVPRPAWNGDIPLAGTEIERSP